MARKLLPWEKLLRQKWQAVIDQERDYWRTTEKLQRLSENLTEIVDIGETFPIASRIYGFHDGCMLLRFKALPDITNFQFIALRASLNNWPNVVSIPLEGKREIHFGHAFRIASGVLRNCSVEGAEIPYLATAVLPENEVAAHSAVNDALFDFQITLCGIVNELHSPANVIARMEEELATYKSLLNNAKNEEAVQRFIKEHSTFLTKCGQFVPKKKLGEDFVTDFVICDVLDQGVRYTLVEIERPIHKLLTKKGQLTSPVNGAIAQTRRWSAWLEQNQDYVQRKLNGFESPRYLIVIGRSNELSDEEKALLRSYNREWKNTEIKTYDDLAVEFEAWLESLRRRFLPGPVQVHLADPAQEDVA